MPSQVRVTVKKKWARNIFYGKLLRDWKELATCPKIKRNLNAAVEGITKYPFHLVDQTELKQVPGIGKTLSSKLDVAYREVCNFMDTEPDMETIERLGRGEALALLKTSKETNNEYKTKPTRTALSQSIENVRIQSQSSQSFATNQLTTKRKCYGIKPSISSLDDIRYSSQLISSQSLNKFNDANENNNYGDALESSIYFVNPSTESGRVLLICDNREQGGNRGYKSVIDHLIKMKVPFELRPLSVGDFVWIWKTPSREIVLDYVVERKSWEDLRASIRSDRLEDQKTRMKECGASHLVLLAEGKDIKDTSLEQCLITFSVTHKFIIQRTETTAETAEFLQILTDRFEERAETETFNGPEFFHYQDQNKKTKPLSVREIFAKQLIVCPQITMDKALLITQRFPNFASLFKLYQINNQKGNEDKLCPKILLHAHISQISVSQSTQLALFFNQL